MFGEGGAVGLTNAFKVVGGRVVSEKVAGAFWAEMEAQLSRGQGTCGH